MHLNTNQRAFLLFALYFFLFLFSSTIDWSAFHAQCSAHLPVYARPAFIRVTQQMALTSTFKHQKGDFAKEGYDLTKIQHGDKVYFYNVKVS